MSLRTVVTNNGEESGSEGLSSDNIMGQPGPSDSKKSYKKSRKKAEKRKDLVQNNNQPRLLPGLAIAHIVSDADTSSSSKVSFNKSNSKGSLAPSTKRNPFLGSTTMLNVPNYVGSGSPNNNVAPSVKSERFKS